MVSGPFLLLGDMNARTKQLNEFLKSDVYNLDVNDDDNMVYERLLNEEILIEYGIPEERFSCDDKSNNNGFKMISMLKNLGLIILNGRVGKDAFIGKVTCKDVSVVDYAIASPVLLPMVYDFEVLSFNEMLSDCHNPLHLILKTQGEQEVNKNEDVNEGCKNDKFKRPRWESEYQDAFIQNLNTGKIAELECTVDRMFSDDNVTQVEIDILYDNIKNVLHAGAKACGSIKVNTGGRKHRRKKSNKPWWNRDCEESRTEFNNARKMNVNDKSNEATEHRKTCSKKYKQTMNKSMNQYHKEMNNKIRKLKSTCPKDYWNIINNSNEKQEVINKLSCEIFAEHLKKLNMGGHKQRRSDDKSYLPWLWRHG